MPIQDRGYYRDENDGYSGIRGSNGPRSIVTMLIIINAAIFLIDAFTGEVGESKMRWLNWMMALKTDGQGVLAESGVAFWQLPFWNLWQLFTYGFAHASITSEVGIMHILFNMVGLFFLGRPVEQRYGREEFLRFYLMALVFAGALSYAFNLWMGVSSTLVGASGAVTAVIILFVLNYPRQTLLIWGVLPAPAWLIGVIIIGSDLMQAMRPSSQIGWYAHLSGAMFALLYFQLRWNFSWLKWTWLTDRLSGKPRLRVHREAKTDAALQAQADRILEKLHREGESSLTRKERIALEKYSRKIRENRH